MMQVLWTFVIVSVVVLAFFFLRPPWSLENIIIHGVPLVLLVIFACRLRQAKKERAAAPPEDDDEEG